LSYAQFVDVFLCQDVALAKISLVIVFVFIVCHSLKWIPNIYELIQVRSSGANLQKFLQPNLLKKHELSVYYKQFICKSQWCSQIFGLWSAVELFWPKKTLNYIFSLGEIKAQTHVCLVHNSLGVWGCKCAPFVYSTGKSNWKLQVFV
jgi:hypothetical protein